MRKSTSVIHPHKWRKRRNRTCPTSKTIIQVNWAKYKTRASETSIQSEKVGLGRFLGLGFARCSDDDTKRKSIKREKTSSIFFSRSMEHFSYYYTKQPNGPQSHSFKREGRGWVSTGPQSRLHARDMRKVSSEEKRWGPKGIRYTVRIILEDKEPVEEVPSLLASSEWKGDATILNWDRSNPQPASNTHSIILMWNN